MEVLLPTISFVAVRLVMVPFAANRFVVVALVIVAFGANNPPKAVRSPVKKPVPPTASVADGVVVPIPSEPPAVKTEERTPAVL